jgi:hypothetical protein
MLIEGFVTLWRIDPPQSDLDPRGDKGVAIDNPLYGEGFIGKFLGDCRDSPNSIKTYEDDSESAEHSF